MECGPLWPRVAWAYAVCLIVPLVVLLVNKVNRTMRLVPNRIMGWILVAAKAWTVFEMGRLVWCATTAEHAGACRAAAAELWRRFREGRPISMGAVPGEAGAAYYFLWPLLPAAVFDPTFVNTETVDVLPGDRILFRQRTYDVKWIRAAGTGRGVVVKRVDPNIGGAVHLANGAVFPNPRFK